MRGKSLQVRVFSVRYLESLGAWCENHPEEATAAGGNCAAIVDGVGLLLLVSSGNSFDKQPFQSFAVADYPSGDRKALF